MPRRISTLGEGTGAVVNIKAAAHDYTAVHDVRPSVGGNSIPGAWGAVEEFALSPEAAMTVDVPPVGDLFNAEIRTRTSALRLVLDGLSNTVLLVEQSGKPTPYGFDRRPLPAGIPAEGAWATAEFASFSESISDEINLSQPFGFHRGATVAMCDGSVQFFRDGMAWEVVAALLSRAGQEIIDVRDWK